MTAKARENNTNRADDRGAKVVKWDGGAYQAVTRKRPPCPPTICMACGQPHRGGACRPKKH